MKTITVYFEDKEMEELKKLKKNTTWHNFIMTLVKNKAKGSKKE